jgi:DNA-binding NarL/FixJ family response regulator
MSSIQRGLSPQLLLIEPDRIVRSTVASVCRGLDLAQVHQAASAAVGLQTLQSQAMDGLLISLVDADGALALLERLRAGAFFGAADMPVAVMATQADAALVERLKAVQIRRLLLQPFKIRDMVLTVEALCAGTPVEA